MSDGHGHGHDHDHGGGYGHVHRPMDELELRSRALESLLYEKGLLTPETVDVLLETFEHDFGPQNEAKVVVCTLCSCYPWSVLGLPPKWYKEPAYRSRVVIEPRVVLSEFGLELSEGVELRVWDSSSEIRHTVLPQRPAGSEGMAEEQLAGLVTRDSMIGVGVIPGPVAA